MKNIRENVLGTLAYFDVFSYPLTREEIHLFSGAKCSMSDISEAINFLLFNRRIYHFDKYYTLHDDHYLIERRVKGNQKAARLMPIACKTGRLLMRFPYVRGVAISGSLSKNFADEDADIDFFIITAKNRLFIARTLMHCLKKLAFLVNRQHYLCMNYYIDQQALQIPEQNIYTATEVVTLIPLEGDVTFDRFFAANSWTRNYLPNNYMRLATARTAKHSWLKRFTEWLFKGKFGNFIDDTLMRITANRWLKKTVNNQRNVKGQVMALHTTKHTAKPNPENFQQRLITQYECRLQQVLTDDKHSVAG